MSVLQREAPWLGALRTGSYVTTSEQMPREEGIRYSPLKELSWLHYAASRVEPRSIASSLLGRGFFGLFQQKTQQFQFFCIALQEVI